MRRQRRGGRRWRGGGIWSAMLPASWPSLARKSMTVVSRSHFGRLAWRCTGPRMLPASWPSLARKSMTVVSRSHFGRLAWRCTGPRGIGNSLITSWRALGWIGPEAAEAAAARRRRRRRGIGNSLITSWRALGWIGPEAAEAAAARRRRRRRGGPAISTTGPLGGRRGRLCGVVPNLDGQFDNAIGGPAISTTGPLGGRRGRLCGVVPNLDGQFDNAIGIGNSLITSWRALGWIGPEAAEAAAAAPAAAAPRYWQQPYYIVAGAGMDRSRGRRSCRRGAGGRGAADRRGSPGTPFSASQIRRCTSRPVCQPPIFPRYDRTGAVARAPRSQRPRFGDALLGPSVNPQSSRAMGGAAAAVRDQARARRRRRVTRRGYGDEFMDMNIEAAPRRPYVTKRGRGGGAVSRGADTATSLWI